jgi:hypothetical protein
MAANIAQRCWLTLATIVAVVYAYLALVSQFCDADAAQYGVSSIAQWGLAQQELGRLTNILDVENLGSQTAHDARNLSLKLPDEARIYIKDMLGPTNRSKAGYYYFLTYFLFPREVGVSLDQPAQLFLDGFHGRPAGSEGELLRNGFNVVMETTGAGTTTALGGLQVKAAANPEWFPSRRDAILAFLLPAFCSLAGLWLVSVLFPELFCRMGLLERFATGLGLGMMAVAALTLGMKLCGFHGRLIVLFVLIASGLARVWNDRAQIWGGVRSGLGSALRSPVFLAGGLLFFMLFRLAGERGLLEFDAVAGWGLKAKILHLYTGHDIVRWFSEPRLAHAHMDYPTLVPALHATTYDSLGRVDEFVTKFWPAWMLLLLAGTLVSHCRGMTGRVQAAAFVVLAFMLLPLTRKFAQFEGATIPMLFFTVLGLVECALWQFEQKSDRLLLGLTLLLGAAMTKFEGCLFLAVVVGWLFVLPWCRRVIERPPRIWRIAGFWAFAVLPFACLRIQIPVLWYESHWAGYALRNPVLTITHWPGIFLVCVSRWFLSAQFADWSGEGGQLSWVGQWEGMSSLYHHPTLGLAWVCLLMTLALWFGVPGRRKTVLWLLAIVFSSVAVVSLIFSCFLGIQSLSGVLGYTMEETAQRYLFPILSAWAMTIMVLLFGEQHSGSNESAQPLKAQVESPRPTGQA